ncbi:MAG TPA: hypothetical protein VIK13_15230 [Candidatus Limnocylindrales bacterium]|jgi:hypothetical protein
MEILFFSLIAMVFGILAVTASELGVDSRDLSDDPHRPAYPVVMN